MLVGWWGGGVCLGMSTSLSARMRFNSIYHTSSKLYQTDTDPCTPFPVTWHTDFFQRSLTAAHSNTSAIDQNYKPRLLTVVVVVYEATSATSTKW